MNCRTLTPILYCSNCGSHLIELCGPIAVSAVVRCGDCGGGAGRFVEFLSDIRVRIERLKQEQPRRRLRYRARKHADPASAWQLILSTPLP